MNLLLKMSLKTLDQIFPVRFNEILTYSLYDSNLFFPPLEQSGLDPGWERATGEKGEGRKGAGRRKQL